MRSTPPVTEMFLSLIADNHIKPVEHMEHLRLPGEYESVPTIQGYGIGDAPILAGVHTDAKLGQRPEGNFYPSSHIK